jgi:hypothetical protein
MLAYEETKGAFQMFIYINLLKEKKNSASLVLFSIIPNLCMAHHCLSFSFFFFIFLFYTEHDDNDVSFLNRHLRKGSNDGGGRSSDLPTSHSVDADYILLHMKSRSLDIIMRQIDVDVPR